MTTALLVCRSILHTDVLSPPVCNKQRASETLYIVTNKIAKSEPRPGVAHLGERGTRQKRNTGNRIPHHQIVYTTGPLEGPIDGYTMHIIYTPGVPHNKPTQRRYESTTRHEQTPHRIMKNIIDFLFVHTREIIQNRLDFNRFPTDLDKYPLRVPHTRNTPKMEY